MEDSERLSRLIAEIYDTALDPALWPQVLSRIGDFVGGPAAALYVKDTVRKTGNVFYQHGVEPEFVQSYFEKYIKLDPFTTTRFFFPIEQIISTVDIMSHEEYYATAFFKGWAQSQGWIDFVSSSLEKSSTTYAECGIFRHERNGVTDERAIRNMRLIVAHVRRAVLISNIVAQHKAEVGSFADALDGIAAGLFLVDSGGRIVHANARAISMFDDQSVVQTTSGKLAATSAEANQLLQDVFANAQRGDKAVGAKGVAIPLGKKGGERYVAHVLPLTSGARRKAAAAYSAVAAVFVRNTTLDVQHPLEVVAQTYNLTRAEMRVLMAIVQIGGVPEVAPVLGTSETTVKTHLQHIFAKTGTSRQADLVKAVAACTTLGI